MWQLVEALPEAARALVGPVTGMVARGASGREIAALVRQAGHPFSMGGPWGRLITAVKEAERYGSVLRNINRTGRINTGALPGFLGDRASKYHFTVRMLLRDEEGTQYERFMTVRTNKDRPVAGDIIRAAESIQLNQYGSEIGDIVRSTIVSGSQTIGPTE